MTLNRTQKWIAYVGGGAVVTASAAIVFLGLGHQEHGSSGERRGGMIPARFEPGTPPAPVTVPPAPAGATPLAGPVPDGAAMVSSIDGLALRPGETFYGRGEELFRSGDYAAASRYLQADVEGRPGRFYPNYLLGLALWKEGRLDESIGSLTAAASIDDASIRARVNLARVLNDAGRFDEALAAGEAAVGLGPDDAAAHNVRGCALLNLARRDEAIAAFTTAVDKDPASAWAHNNLGYALIGADRCDEAVVPLERAVQIDPGVGVFHNNLGMAYERTGRRDEAVQEYRAAVLAGATGAAERNLDRLGGAVGDPGPDDDLEDTAPVAAEPEPAQD